MSDVPAFLGLRVLTSFACALGESALPFMGSADRGGPVLPSILNLVGGTTTLLELRLYPPLAA